LSKVHLSGDVLDLGGSKTSGYHELFSGNPRIIVGNIDSSYGIDIQMDAEKKFPFPDQKFDGVLMINLIEHLFDHQKAIQESFRVLKPGGRIIGVVPFMFNVHGSPNDYFRYTKSALERLFINQGFKTVQVEEIGTGAFSVAYHLFVGFMRIPFLTQLCMQFARVLDTALKKIKPTNKMGSEHMPLGYFFEVIK
jgi:SAM-dependent methyltransferase